MSENVETKFQAAAEIANSCAKALLAKLRPGADIAELCRESDELIRAETQKGLVGGGIAFPTCISVNEIAGNFAPEETQRFYLKEGDVVKIDLGVQIDGFPALVGHTHVINSDDRPITGRIADVLMAAHTAAEAAVQAINVGKTNYDVTSVLEKSYRAYNCSGVHGALSHQVAHNLYDGKRIIHNKDLPDERVDLFQFESGMYFVLEAAVSTGSGEVRTTDHSTMIYKHDADNAHPMKTPLTRQFVADLLKYRPIWPYHNREEPDKKRRTLGTVECLRNYMLQAWPVVADQPGEIVAKFCYTVHISPEGTCRKLTGLPFDQAGRLVPEMRVEQK